MKFYEVYTFSGSLGYTRTKEEAKKLQRFYNYIGPFKCYIRERRTIDPSTSSKFQIPSILYVKAIKALVPSRPNISFFMIETYTDFRDKNLLGVYEGSEKPKEYVITKSPDGKDIVIIFTIETKPRETRNGLVKRAHDKAVEIYESKDGLIL